MPTPQNFNLANLSPEELALLQQALGVPRAPTSGSGWQPNTAPGNEYTAADGNTWHGGYSGGSGPSGEAGIGNQEAINTLGFFRDASPGHNSVGDLQHGFDPTTGQYMYSGRVPVKENGVAPALMFLGGAGLTLAGLGAAGAAAGAANGSWDILPEAIGSSGGGSTFTLPMMSSELPAVSSSFAGEFAPAAAGGAAGAGTASAGGGGSSGTLSKAALDGTNAFGANSVPGAYNVSGGGGMGWLSDLKDSGWLGPAASLLGGVLGSQQREQSQTSRNEIDPRMVPFLYGENGAMPLAQQQMLRQMNDPRIAQMYSQMRDRGGWLMQQPVAGNGFSRFFPGR